MDSATAHNAYDAAPIWQPSPQYIAGSHVERLMHALGIEIDRARPEKAWKNF